DMEVDNNAGLVAIDGYKGQGDPTDVMSSSDPGKTVGYGIYLGTMTFDVTNPLNPLITAEGSPVANGPDSLSGGLLGTSIPGITVECGSLYDPDAPVDAPGLTGTLFSVQVSKLVTAMTLTADEDTRGGIVMEDGTVANLVSPPAMLAWLLPTQADGDANNDNFVDVADFNILAAAFFKDYNNHYPGAYDPRADFDHSGRVDVADFNILAAKFFKVPASVPVGTPPTWPPL
ncbi:MAG: hypothetical protein GY869_04970, partial [Planctomycetes bacterium]|nr:hypothetical protein [Planctomycetota bacterium]